MRLCVLKTIINAYEKAEGQKQPLASRRRMPEER